MAGELLLEDGVE